MERVYSFAIVRICPDPRRGELVNIGITVFLPRRLDVRILPTLGKVHALHGELDLAALYALPEKLSAYAKIHRSVAERYALIRKVGMVELSDLGQFRSKDEAEYEQTVQTLITQLVAPTVAPFEKEAPQSRLQSQVRKIIRDVKILGRHQGDFDKHKIVQNYPIAPGKGLYADFAGQNSQFHVTETIDFRVDRGIRGPKFNESAKAAFVLREARALHADSNRFLFYAATAEVESQVAPHLALLGEFATDFVNFESASDRGRYAQRLAVAFGGELPLLSRAN
jgi:hypothetical protein